MNQKQERTTTKEAVKNKSDLLLETEHNKPVEIESESIEPYKIYNNKIESYIDDFIDTYYPNKSQEELKQDKAFFPLLVDYLYNNCICKILNNKSNKNVLYEDINLLDELFNIYTRLVYIYKWSNKPYLIEFSLFTGINHDTFYNWINGIDNNIAVGKSSGYLTRERSDMVRKWQVICERALLDNNDTIKDIFILKAKHGYRDNNNDITITVNHKPLIDADNLPDLIGINGKN